MSNHHTHVPQLDADLFLTGGGLGTTLIFDDGLNVPDFAAVAMTKRQPPDQVAARRRTS